MLIVPCLAMGRDHRSLVLFMGLTRRTRGRELARRARVWGVPKAGPSMRNHSIRARPWSPRVRWAISATLLVVGFLAILVTYLVPEARICRDVALQTSVVVVCAPIGTEDIVAVSGYLLVATLPMWPELAKLTIGGFVFEKATGARDLDEAGSKRPGGATR